METEKFRMIKAPLEDIGILIRSRELRYSKGKHTLFTLRKQENTVLRIIYEVAIKPYI